MGMMAGVENTQAASKYCGFWGLLVIALSTILILVVLLSLASYSLADTPINCFNRVGCPTRVVNGKEVAAYVYDDVGNLHVISRPAINTHQPVIQRINPTHIFLSFLIKYGNTNVWQYGRIS